jgi:hypothetical protein
VCGVVWLLAEGGRVKKTAGGLAVGFLWGGRNGRTKKKKNLVPPPTALLSLSLSAGKSQKFSHPLAQPSVFYSCFAPFLGNPLWTSRV